MPKFVDIRDNQYQKMKRMSYYSICILLFCFSKSQR